MTTPPPETHPAIRGYPDFSALMHRRPNIVFVVRFQPLAIGQYKTRDEAEACAAELMAESARDSATSDGKFKAKPDIRLFQNRDNGNGLNLTDDDTTLNDYMSDTPTFREKMDSVWRQHIPQHHPDAVRHGLKDSIDDARNRCACATKKDFAGQTTANIIATYEALPPLVKEHIEGRYGLIPSHCKFKVSHCKDGQERMRRWFEESAAAAAAAIARYIVGKIGNRSQTHKQVEQAALIMRWIMTTNNLN